MTDRAQFEAMLEALINEDHEQAKEIFHNIVVGKSREIYEELLAEDFSPEEANKAIGGHTKTEGMEEEEEESMEEEAEEEESDSEDDAEADSEDDAEEPEDDGEEMPFGDEEGEEGDMDDMGDEADGDIEDRVMDLEDALEDLKAEFEQLLAGEEHEEEHEPGIHGDGMPMHDIAGDMDMGGEHDELETMMEYVNKVAAPKHGDNGVNTKSVVDNMKNDMGGTTANIAKNFSTTSGGTQGGLLKPTTGDLTAGLGNIQNRPDAKAGKTGFKTQVKDAHGAEKAGKKETADNKKSTISTRVR
jgi:hypothetical protein